MIASSTGRLSSQKVSRCNATCEKSRKILYRRYCMIRKVKLGVEHDTPHWKEKEPAQLCTAVDATESDARRWERERWEARKGTGRGADGWCEGRYQGGRDRPTPRRASDPEATPVHGPCSVAHTNQASAFR